MSTVSTMSTMLIIFWDPNTFFVIPKQPWALKPLYRDTLSPWDCTASASFKTNFLPCLLELEDDFETRYLHNLPLSVSIVVTLCKSPPNEDAIPTSPEKIDTNLLNCSLSASEWNQCLPPLQSSSDMRKQWWMTWPNINRTAQLKELPPISTAVKRKFTHNSCRWEISLETGKQSHWTAQSLNNVSTKQGQEQNKLSPVDKS